MLKTQSNYISKAALKKNVLRALLNDDTVFASLTSIGNPFHSLGANTQKDRSPYVRRFDLGISSGVKSDAERSTRSGL